MAVPAELIAAHGVAMEAVETLASRDLLSVWRSLDLSDARGATTALLPVARDVTAAYGDVAASMAADFYEDARAEAGPSGRFSARAAPVAPSGQVDAMVRWAVTPLWATDPRFGVALRQLAGGTQRLIRKAERDTIFESGRRDTALATWVRVTHNDACEFCLMLAARGDVYQTRESALQVVGRDGRTRGNRPLGEQFHDNCRCRTVPTWSSDDIPDANRQLADEWRDVTRGERDQLAAWRRHINETRPHQHVVRP